MNKNGQDQKVSYQNLVIIWAALFLSQALFLVVVYLTKPEFARFGEREPAEPVDLTLPLVLAGVSLAIAVASFILKQRLLTQAVSLQKPALVQTAMIVGCAMCEAISVFGVVLAFAASFKGFFAWIVAGMATMIFHFPSRSALQDASFGNRQI